MYKKNPGKWHPTPHNIKTFYVDENNFHSLASSITTQAKACSADAPHMPAPLVGTFPPHLSLLPGTCLLAINAHPSCMPDSRTFWGRGGQAVLTAAVDPAGCTIQPLIVGAPVPPIGKRWEVREGRTPAFLDSPRNSSGWEGSGGRMCLWPLGPLTCHPSSLSGESLGWFPRLCLTSAIIYFWQQIPHSYLFAFVSTLSSPLPQNSRQKSFSAF